MTAYSAQLPTGQSITKNSSRSLTHLVVAQAPGSDSWFAARWCSSQKNAQAAINSIWPTYAKRIIACTAA